MGRREGGSRGGWGRCLRGCVVRGGWLNKSGGGGGRGVGDSCVLIPGRVLRAGEGERERERNIELTLQLFECLRILICLLLTGRRRESYNYVTLVVIVQDNH